MLVTCIYLFEDAGWNAVATAFDALYGTKITCSGQRIEEVSARLFVPCKKPRPMLNLLAHSDLYSKIYALIQAPIRRDAPRRYAGRVFW